MAQPVYEDHPLDAYLKQSGEIDIMPGGTPGFTPDDLLDTNTDAEDTDVNLLPPAVWDLILNVMSLLDSHRSGYQNRELAERFKYDVISSSLLSSSLTSHPGASRSMSPDLPGRLHIPDSPPTPSGNLRVHDPPGDSFALGCVAVGLLAASARLYWLSVFCFGTALHAHLAAMQGSPPAEGLASAFLSLADLVAANDSWNAVVQEAVSILEREDRNVFAMPSEPSSAIACLRIALTSSLHTTRTQCEKVRHLFAALTSAGDLGPLSEMYAPPSPAFGDVRARTLSSPPPNKNKRATWNGATGNGAAWNGVYSSLASLGSPLREMRLAIGPDTRPSAASAPVTPYLRRVPNDMRTPGSPDYFTADSLNLQRRRTTRGLQSLSLGTSTPSSSRHPISPTRTSGFGLGISTALPAASTITTPSRLTPVHSTRHPLGVGALSNALQGALAAKRYACSHLLALRFTGADACADEYWDDVKSVMALLASTLSDAGARLAEALDDVERERISHATPSAPPTGVPGHSRSASLASALAAEDGRPLLGELATIGRPRPLSFAPTPSHVVRFAGHVEAMSSALADAREQLQATVRALQTPVADPFAEDSGSALRAYERVRGELGRALRECERGRERLLDILARPADEEDVPPLEHDGGSEEASDPPGSSDRAHPVSPLMQDRTLAVRYVDGSDDDGDEDGERNAVTVQLPPAPPMLMGIEQVFEGESGISGSFARERSKMSREERIAAAKTRRSLQLSTPPPPPRGAPGERWGPGVDVVQELKDVIWKVGERRRRLAGAVESAEQQGPDTSL